MTDWAQIKTEYITTDTTYRELGKKYGVSYSIIGKVASRENWVELKQQHNNSCVTKALNADAKKKASEMLRVVHSAGRLLDKLDKAIEELEIQSVKKAKREKVIEYKYSTVPGKPTKEVVTEEEEVKEVLSSPAVFSRLRCFCDKLNYCIQFFLIYAFSFGLCILICADFGTFAKYSRVTMMSPVGAYFTLM